MAEQSLFSILQQIEKYEEVPRQTPKILLEQLTKKVFAGKKTLVELLAIGGEGVVLKLLDETGKQIVAKIARSDSQNREITSAKHIDESGKFIKNSGKKNTSYERFLEGAILQRDFFELMLSEQIILFGIPQVKELSTSPLYFTMPFFENISVLRFFHDFKKTIVYALHVFYNLLQAVKYVHSKSIVHRDLKSDNLLISRNFESVIILDWTLAKQIGDRGLTINGIMGGTPGFAPEKMLENGKFKDANFRDDIHALGFVLWEFSTGKRLRTVLNDTLEKREEIKKRIVEYMPDFLQPVFWTATETDERKRYQSIDEFSEAIKRAISIVGERNTVTLISQQQSEEIDVIVDTKPQSEHGDVVFPACENCVAMQKIQALQKQIDEFMRLFGE